MERINEIVYGILRESLFGEPFDNCGINAEELNDETLASVLSELQLQTVLCFADKWFMAHQPQDERIAKKWRRLSRDYQIRVLYILSAQKKLVELLDENGIEFVIIKGAAASVLYKDPFLRLMGDIDFLVKRKDFDRTAALLEANGFELDQQDLSNIAHHNEYRKYGITFELHRRLPIVDGKNERLLNLFEKGIDERIDGHIEWLRFPMLPNELNGMVLLFHINQHLREGLGLRQILDWMMFVDRHIDDAAWEQTYSDLFESVGMSKFAMIVTEMCKRHLGLRKDITWCSEAEPGVCDRFLNYIMERGNFGVKTGEEGHVSAVFLRSSNPFKILARLQQKGLASWGAAKKHAVLRPFAWIYEFNRQRKHLKNNNISVSKISSLKSQGVRQREFIESLGLDADRIIYDTD